MDSFHPLLRRQWQRYLGRETDIPVDLHPFLQAVSESYAENDLARLLGGRALELSSEELRAAIAELRGVLAALPDLLFRVRADDRISSVMGSGSDLHQPAMLGLLEPSARGNPGIHAFWAAVRRVRVTHLPTEFEYQPGYPGEGVFYHVRLLPFVGQDILGVFRDITAEKRAEETKRLLELERHQAQKMESLGSLAGGVAHDFNNMLGSIMGFADLLLAGEPDRRRQAHLQSILLAASRSAALTQKLLAFGRRGKNLVESLDLQAMAVDCLELLRPSMSPDLQVTLAMEGCPKVDGDPSQIHQVLMNLCLNAMEAMPAQGRLTLAAMARCLPDPSLPTLALPPGAYVDLTVSDTGKGMTEEVRHRIFEPFFTTKRGTGMAGTGLGLATTYGIVQAHHGAIVVVSSPAQGSTFHVFLPVGVGVLRVVEREPTAGSIPGQGMILLVEDEPLLMDAAAAILESLGYETLPAVDGLEAVELFRVHHQRLSLVLLDLKMPRMGGREAFPAFQDIDPSVPVLVCTGFGDNEEVQALLDRGAVGMLAKPYRISELATKLKQILPRPMPN